MKSYNGFSGEIRKENSKLIEKAVKVGLKQDSHETTCWICGQDKGIREYHAEDYSEENIVEESKIICWRCHRHIHATNHTDNWHKYEEDVDKGIVGKPVYRKGYWTEDDDKPIKHRTEPVGFKYFWKYHEEMLKKLNYNL